MGYYSYNPLPKNATKADLDWIKQNPHLPLPSDPNAMQPISNAMNNSMGLELPSSYDAPTQNVTLPGDGLPMPSSFEPAPSTARKPVPHGQQVHNQPNQSTTPREEPGLELPSSF